VRATPELAFPVNSQVPPVAYASEPYQYKFSDSTFRSDSPKISYTLADAPTWLSLDSDQKSFKGSPATADVGSSTFQLRAADDQGETAAEVTLVILDGPYIGQGMPILSHLQAAGPVSAPSTLLLKPLQPFSIILSPDVFSGTSSSTRFYAISADQSPLPPWIQFEASRLAFFGTTPPLVSPNTGQQVYDFSLIASDVPGFAQSAVEFHLSISYSILRFVSPNLLLNVTLGTHFISSPLIDSLTIDGRPLQSEELKSARGDLPNWLTLDPTSIVLSGNVPDAWDEESFIVSAIDSYGNVAEMNVILTMEDNAETGTDVGSTQNVSTIAVIGEDFSYTLPSSITEEFDDLSAAFSDSIPWLTFDSQNKTIRGHVPSDVRPGQLNVTFITANAGGSPKIRLSIVLRPGVISSSTITIATSSTIRTSPSGAPTEEPRSNESIDGRTRPKHIIAIVVTVVITILVVFLSISFLAWWLKRRSRRREKGKGSAEPDESVIEHPEQDPASDDLLPNAADLPPVVGSSRTTSVSRRTPAYAPQIELAWAPDSLQKTKARLSRKLQKRPPGSFDSSWSGLIARPETQAGEDLISQGLSERQLENLGPPPPIPQYAAVQKQSTVRRPVSRRGPKGSDRGSKVLRVIASAQVGLPKRRSGAGHGSGILTADPHPASLHRSSWHTTLGSLLLAELRNSDTALASFPAPPTPGTVDKENAAPASAPNVTKPSVRLVNPSREPSESFEAQRQRWHTERAKDRLEGVARFSNTGSSRTFSMPRTGVSAFSPSRTMSPTILEDGSPSSQPRDPSWSRWSGIGPGGRTKSPMNVGAPAPLFTRGPTRLPREVSVASSGQFDSALSSESRWEDENLVAEVNEAGERKWHTDTESAAPSPRLPFDPFSASQENLEEVRAATMLRGARLIDKRSRVSVDSGEVHRSEKSHTGSFRFI
jgi:axial budding pattern protein 2